MISITFKDTKKLIHQDIQRLSTNVFINFILNPGFRYVFHWRMYVYCKQYVLLLPIAIVLRIGLMVMQYIYGIKIGTSARLGGGLRIYHYGGIFINDECIIGENVDIWQDVTLGKTHSRHGKLGGSPTIKNNVIIFPGAKIIGPVTVGRNVVVGANALVCKDIPDNVSVGCHMAHIISNHGSKGLQYMRKH